VKPKAPCSVCGLSKNAYRHVGITWDHDFVDSRPKAWRKRKAEQLVKEPECVLKGLDYGPCWGPIDVHHAQPRGAGGTSHDDSPLFTLCRKHHDYIEEHRELGRSLGLLGRRGGGLE
jgi:hypothetical protein